MVNLRILLRWRGNQQTANTRTRQRTVQATSCLCVRRDDWSDTDQPDDVWVIQYHSKHQNQTEDCPGHFMSLCQKRRLIRYGSARWCLSYTISQQTPEPDRGLSRPLHVSVSEETIDQIRISPMMFEWYNITANTRTRQRTVQATSCLCVRRDDWSDTDQPDDVWVIQYHSKHQNQTEDCPGHFMSLCQKRRLIRYRSPRWCLSYTISQQTPEPDRRLSRPLHVSVSEETIDQIQISPMMFEWYNITANTRTRQRTVQATSCLCVRRDDWSDTDQPDDVWVIQYHSKHQNQTEDCPGHFMSLCQERRLIRYRSARWCLSYTISQQTPEPDRGLSRPLHVSVSEERIDQIQISPMMFEWYNITANTRTRQRTVQATSCLCVRRDDWSDTDQPDDVWVIQYHSKHQNQTEDCPGHFMSLCQKRRLIRYGSARWCLSYTISQQTPEPDRGLSRPLHVSVSEETIDQIRISPMMFELYNITANTRTRQRTVQATSCLCVRRDDWSDTDQPDDVWVIQYQCCSLKRFKIPPKKLSESSEWHKTSRQTQLTQGLLDIWYSLTVSAAVSLLICLYSFIFTFILFIIIK